MVAPDRSLGSRIIAYLLVGIGTCAFGLTYYLSPKSGFMRGVKLHSLYFSDVNPWLFVVVAVVASFLGFGCFAAGLYILMFPKGNRKTG